MTEKQTTNKQMRHQSAKQKYKHYHRVLSCKNLMRNVAPIVPSPGQFVVQNNKNVQLPKLGQSKSYSVLLTKNIRNIVTKTNPVPFGQMINQLIQKKSPSSKPKSPQSQTHFRRPISAKIYHETEGKQLQQSQILRQAFNDDRQFRKKESTNFRNYFQVKPKLKIPKHIHGYNTVVLKDNKKDEIDEDFQSKVEKIGEQCQKSFLPTQYYMNQIHQPEQLMAMHKNQNGIVFGFSRWFHNDGSHSWRRCRILGYLKQEERWEIQWLCSGVMKKVSRNNLYFQKENFQEFQRTVQAAEESKRKSQIYMKYNILINLINTPTPQFPLQSQNKIKSLINLQFADKKIANGLQEYKHQLMQETKRLFARACHQFEFNSMLPYNASCKKVFSQVLPPQLFSPNPLHQILNQPPKIQLNRSECTQLFTSGLKKLRQKSFLTSQKKIKILQLITLISQQLSCIDLLKDYKKLSQKIYTISQLDSILSRNIAQYFYKINCRICDIQHHVSKQLDPLYANKKNIPQDAYQATIGRYERFLLLVNMRIEEALRESVCGVVSGLIRQLPKFARKGQNNNDGQTGQEKQNQVNWDVIYLQQSLNLKIALNANIKEGNLQINPKQNQLTNTVMKNIDKILCQLGNIKCVSKSYLPEVRPDNLLQVLHKQQQKQKFDSKSEQIIKLEATVEELRGKLKFIEDNIAAFINSLSLNIEEIFKNNSQLHKKFQKKNSYGEIQQIIQKINGSQRQINKLIKVKQFNLCGIFVVNFQQVKAKSSNKIMETMKQVVSMLIDKIHKDNQKLDKSVSVMLETMQKVPNSIAEFVQLEKFVNQQVKQQIQKTHHKAKTLTEKMNLLEKTSQTIQYREFESCCQIYLKPLKLKKARQETIFKLQNIYKKNFAEELMKDSYSVLDNIKNCQKLLAQSLNHKTLQQMDRNFSIFSQLHQQIETSYQKMSSINQKQSLLKWTKTNFDRLLQLKQQSQPYYKLITLHKNHRLNLLPLLQQSFPQISYPTLWSNISTSLSSLQYLLHHKFNSSPVYEPIVQSILKEYEEFNRYMPLIRALRNADLRDRHWVRIEGLVGNLRAQGVLLKDVIRDSVRLCQAEIQRISNIATKELIYEKLLNQLKRDWKDVRINCREVKIGNEVFKGIKNIQDIQKKLQNDMLEVNNILASSFIKFLQADVTHWKSSVLQKVYEFINYWPTFQNKILFYLRLINSHKMSQLFQHSQSIQKNFQKFWKQFMTNIEFQSVIVDIANSRTWESINNLQAQMEEIQKIICQYLEEKKKINAKLRLFSDQALISMMVESNNEVALANIKKCFTGAKSVKFLQQPVPAQKQQIQIMSTLDQKIILILEQPPKAYPSTQVIQQNNLSALSCQQISSKATYQFDELLLCIDKQLKKQIKSTFLHSLQHSQEENDEKEGLLCQVQILRARLIFRNQIQKEMRQSQSLDNFQIQAFAQQKQYIQKIRKVKNKSKAKIISFQIIQSINQLNLIKKLSKLDNPLTSFQWFKTPKYQLSDIQSISSMSCPSSKLKFSIGAHMRQYQFELTPTHPFISTTPNDCIFLNICTSLSDRMLTLIEGQSSSSRSFVFLYLGQLMGRNVTELDCEMGTIGTVMEYFKIAASGIFVVMKGFDRMAENARKGLEQGIANFWVQYQLARNNVSNFKIGTEDYLLDSTGFAFFGIIQTVKPFKKNDMTIFSQAFRVFHVYPIDTKYLLKCALISVGLTGDQRFEEIFHIVDTILKEINYWKVQEKFISVNKNVFVWQIAKRFQTLLNLPQTITTQNLSSESQLQLQYQTLIQSIIQVLKIYIPQQFQTIWQSFYNLKLIDPKSIRRKGKAFTKLNLEELENEKQQMKQKGMEIKRLKQKEKGARRSTKRESFSAADYTISQLTQKFQQGNQHKRKVKQLKDILQFHCGAIVIGGSMTGKTSVITSLTSSSSSSLSPKYNLASLNPLAYTLSELYQSTKQQKSIIRQIIEQLKIKSTALELHSNSQIINAIHFDTPVGTSISIGEWARPLLSVVNSPENVRICCPDGTLVTLPMPFKLIFQSENLEHLGPNDFHSLGIVSMKQEVPWKKLFRHLIQKYFTNNFSQSLNAQFIRQIFQQTFDSVLDFYQSLSKQKPNQFLLSKPSILELVIKFFSQVYSKQDISPIPQMPEPQKQSEQRTKSQIFSCYTYSLLSTLGLLIPQQSRRTFSRHFRYVLEQNNLCRYGCKKSNIFNVTGNLNGYGKEEDNVFEYWYQGGQWAKWEQGTKGYGVVERVLQHHVAMGTPCFVVGEKWTSKDYLFKKVLGDLESQKHTKSYFSCSSLTNKENVSKRIAQMIHTQKYSRKVNGFSNCKKNIIYIQDLNMTMSEPAKNGSLSQFIQQFYTCKSWYIQKTLYQFHNLQFYGTLTASPSSCSSSPFPQRLLRHLNPIFISNPQNRHQSILQAHIANPSLSTLERDLIIRCTINLQEVIVRDMAQFASSAFSLTDMIRIVRGVAMVADQRKGNALHSLLRYWVYLADRVYSQKIPLQKKSFLFYLINNVLMEQQRVRYKTICPTSDFYVIPSFHSANQPSSISYESHTISTLQQKFYKVAHEANWPYLSLFLDESMPQLLKLAVKFINSLEFQSKVVIVFNEQKRPIRTVLKIVSFFMKGLLINFQANLSFGADQHELQEISKKFCQIYFQNFQVYSQEYRQNSNGSNIGSKIGSPIQSILQSKKNMQSQLDQKSQKLLKQKNRLLLHFTHSGSLSCPSCPFVSPNPLLESLLSVPSSIIPAQLVPQSPEEPQKSKPMHQPRHDSQLQAYRKQIDLMVVLQYSDYDDYLRKYYGGFVGDCAVVALEQSQGDGQARVAVSSKIIMTDVSDEDIDQEYNGDQFGVQIKDQAKLQMLINKYGRKVYYDLVYNVFQAYLEENWVFPLPKRSLAFRQSFRSIFGKFELMKKEKKLKKQSIQQKIKGLKQYLVHIQSALTQQLKQQKFNFSQASIRLSQTNLNMQKQQQRYHSQKKKLQQLSQKIAKKQKEYQQNLQQYRAIMDKYAFQFVKVKQKLVKMLVMFQTGKYNIGSINMNNQNKLLIQSLCLISYLVDIKKNQDISNACIRQFTKTLKQKKLSKTLSKHSLQSLNHKHLPRLEKLLSFLQAHKPPTSQPSTNKKIPNIQPDQQASFKATMHSYLQVCFEGGKEYYAQGTRGIYESIQTIGKNLEKINAQYGKKVKNKGICQLFANYEAMQVETTILKARVQVSATRISQIENALKVLQSLFCNHLPLLPISSPQAPNENSLLSSLFLRFYNELSPLDSTQLSSIFSSIKQQMLALCPTALGEDGNGKEGDEWNEVRNLFKYRGVVLVKVSNQELENGQSNGVVWDFIYKNGNCVQIGVQDVERKGIIQQEGQGIIVKITQDMGIQRIQLFIDYIMKSKWIVNGPIFIEAKQFTEQMKANYPFIDFSAKYYDKISTKNRQNGSSARLPYKYIYSKCKQHLYPTQELNLFQQQTQLESLKPISQQAGPMLQFFLAQLQKHFPEITSSPPTLPSLKQLPAIQQNICLFYQAVRPLFHQPEPATMTEPHIAENKEVLNLTDKQRQKIYSQGKICQFFTKLYMTGWAWGNRLPLNMYFGVVSKVIARANANCYSITNNQECTTFKFIHLIKKYLPDFIPNLPNSILMGLCNARTSTFTCQQNYTKYIYLFLNQLRLSSSQSAPPSSSQSPSPPPLPALSQIPSLLPLRQEIQNDYQFWLEDVDTLLKEQKELPVQFYYVLAVCDWNKFKLFVGKMEIKLIGKYIPHGGVDIGVQSISSAMTSLNTNISKQQSNLSIQSLLLPPTNSYFQLISFLISQKIEPKILPIHSSLMSSPSTSPLQSKLLLCLSPSPHQALMPALQAPQKKSTDEQPQLLLTSTVQNYLPLRQLSSNWLFDVQGKEATFVRINFVMEKIYGNLLADRVKAKEYETMGIGIKRILFEILAVVLQIGDLCISPDVGYGVYYAVERCLAIIDKLLKQIKSKNSQTTDIVSTWKCLITQILLQLTNNTQYETILSIFCRVQKLSTKFVELQSQPYTNASTSSNPNSNANQSTTANLNIAHQSTNSGNANSNINGLLARTMQILGQMGLNNRYMSNIIQIFYSRNMQLLNKIPETRNCSLVSVSHILYRQIREQKPPIHFLQGQITPCAPSASSCPEPSLPLIAYPQYKNTTSIANTNANENGNGNGNESKQLFIQIKQTKQIKDKVDMSMSGVVQIGGRVWSV